MSFSSGRYLFVLTALLGYTLVAHISMAEDLPLRRVVMFTAGVGFFQHEGTIDGDGCVEFDFHIDEINDLLKSLVVQDHGGGVVANVTYEAREPIGKKLHSLAIDLTSSPTLTDLLTQLRGARVSVRSDDDLQGIVMGVEIRTRRVDDETRRSEFVNLLTDVGVQSIDIDTLRAVKVLDEKLATEIQRALALIDQTRSDQRKSVSVHFRGEGQRRITIGYIRDCPVWKASYRLVLDAEQPPLLQGWAIAENTTEKDWENVQLTLVSGRPVSFVMDLYEPLYAQRPHVMPQLPGNVAPRLHQHGFATRSEASPLDGSFGGAGGAMFGGAAMGMGSGMGGIGAQGMGGMGGYPGTGVEPAPAGTTQGSDFDNRPFEGDAARSITRQDLQQSVVPDVTADEPGELFHYEIALPVTVPQNRSAMLPIANEDVQVERLSVYNRQIHARHPMRGLRLTNTTPLHLMQGPVTVFEDGAFAGDARMEDLTPGAARLVTYALDLEVETVWQQIELPRQLARIRVRQGMLQADYTLGRNSSYLLENTSDRTRDLVLEQTIDEDFELQTRDALNETTADLYRFALTLAPAEQKTFIVSEQKTLSESTPLVSLDDTVIQRYLAEASVPQPVKDLLTQLVGRRLELARLEQEVEDHNERIQRLGTWQARIRENIKVLDRTHQLYETYTRQLADQEEQLQQLHEELITLNGDQRRVEAEIDELVRGANIE